MAFPISSTLTRLALVSWSLLVPLMTLGAEPVKSAGEYQIKAVYLYNFTKFVDWPGSAFGSTNAPLVIGVLGEDPFGKVLDDTVRNEVVHHRPLVVRRLNGTNGVTDCHVLFISQSERAHLEEVIQQIGSRPVLTVADTPKAAEQGVMINLVVQDSVRMEANPGAMKEARLQMSSKLLSLARIVKPSRPPVSRTSP